VKKFGGGQVVIVRAVDSGKNLPFGFRSVFRFVNVDPVVQLAGLLFEVRPFTRLADFVTQGPCIEAKEKALEVVRDVEALRLRLIQAAPKSAQMLPYACRGERDGQNDDRGRAAKKPKANFETRIQAGPWNLADFSGGVAF
jgi:hypothetical protein